MAQFSWIIRVGVASCSEMKEHVMCVLGSFANFWHCSRVFEFALRPDFTRVLIILALYPACITHGDEHASLEQDVAVKTVELDRQT